MTEPSYSGLFIAEGSSDLPLADIVESLFFTEGVALRLSKPDFAMLGKVRKDVRSRVTAGLKLARGPVDLIVVHRDADNAGHHARRDEITTALRDVTGSAALIPIIPVKMTEAWLLLDEALIRQVAGNPRGRMPLGLPKAHEVESLADPKAKLQSCLLTAAEATGRRHETVKKRFNEHRRQLLERLDITGPVSTLRSWQRLVDDVTRVVEAWS
jgi:hypothetical protein